MNKIQRIFEHRKGREKEKCKDRREKKKDSDEDGILSSGVSELTKKRKEKKKRNSSPNPPMNEGKN